jgi:hypothetical protein
MSDKKKSVSILGDSNILNPEGDSQVGLQVFQILGEILRHKEDLGLPQKWVRNYQLGKNQHWKIKTKKAGLLTANLLHTHRQKNINMLTDNNPTFNISKIDTQDEAVREAVDDLFHACQYWWNEQEQQSVFEESVLNGETYGITIEKVFFNPDLEYGIGEVETEVVDPFYFGIYPVTCKDIQKAEAVLHYYPVTLREAKRKFPQFADKIVADGDFLSEIGDVRNELTANATGKSNVMNTMRNTLGTVMKFLNSSVEESDKVLLVECWVKDYTLITDEEGFLRPKYKGFIRCVTTCNGGNIVLSDRSNPSINPLLPDELARKTYLYDKFPFAYANSLKDTTNIWGMSDFEQLESLQVEINKTVTQLTYYKDKATRLKVINPKDSGVPNEHFTNAPSIINPANSMVANAIRYMETPPLPSDLYNVLNIYRDLFYVISGGFDLEQAQAQSKQVISYKAIATLIERASMIMKGKVRAYSKLIRDRGRMYLSHLMNWYDTERWITYRDQEGNEYVKTILGRELIIPVKLSVVSGSTMPVSKVQEREEALELFKMGAIDAEELLKKLDWSDYKGVVKRMQAGVIGSLAEKLQALGFPPEFLEVIQKIAEMKDDKEFRANVQGGVIPTFSELSRIIQEGANQTDPMAQKEAIEAQKIQAEIQKLMAEALLLQEKANSEKVDQMVKQSGVGFDEEKLNIEKAKTAQELKAKLKEANNLIQQNVNRNNQMADMTGIENLVPTAEQRGTAPYREKGLFSNNSDLNNLI